MPWCHLTPGHLQPQDWLWEFPEFGAAHIREVTLAGTCRMQFSSRLAFLNTGSLVAVLNRAKWSLKYSLPLIGQENLKKTCPITVDSRYLALVGSQNSRAPVKWFSRYLALSREGADSRIQDHRPTLPGVYNSQTVCWAIIEVLTFPGSLHTSTSHQRQITTSNIRF